MRTTVTLDPDTEQLLRAEMRETGQNFKVTLNKAIRRGLSDNVRRTEQKPFLVRAKNMGPLRPGVDPAKLQQLADEMDVEAHLEVTRRLEERLAQSKS